MFCPKCGAQLPDNIRFCSTCGFDLTRPSANASQPAGGESLEEKGAVPEGVTTGTNLAGSPAPAANAAGAAGVGGQGAVGSTSSESTSSKYRLGVIGLLGLSLFLMFLPWVDSKYILGNSSFTMLELMNQVKGLSEYAGTSVNSLSTTASVFFLVWLFGLLLGGFTLFAHLRKMDTFAGFFRASLLSPAIAGVVCAIGIMSIDQNLHSAIGSAGSSYGSTGRAVASAVNSGVGVGAGMALYLCVAASVAAFILYRKVRQEEA